MLVQQTYHSPLGPITLASTKTAVVGLWFQDQRYYGARYQVDQMPIQTTAPLQQAKTWLAQYFAGQNPNPKMVPLQPEVMPFQQRVLIALQRVPYGTTTTYSDLAAAVSTPSARAVGNAIGHNPISLLIPCHRVLGKNGRLTGYAGGLERKRALLQLEQRS
ncbi:methylated-DNA--[protein]-cysteine S-methyltransferase [Fructilactobacillus myrtifloralis]|uniref:Methylated-DNA--protein-cysteine methyltransferase n=1 Tax=Fructilactobacillus myrtifloralis TaxID=2940301 RepID=A0ABY5BRM7_9LACO|nr:methylated-DNA--[protein]-cysteine S-methyltransferase [Fructilactobacillus myrtifloralis]USS85718.1 methylated-DNA--[protein]-cysteine S-methyltransferase [Fructilactobacillus myrtifloralis]